MSLWRTAIQIARVNGVTLVAHDEGLDRLGWQHHRLVPEHDAMRSKAAGDGGVMTVRTAEPTRDIEHLTRLFAEHLGKVQFLAPVGYLEMIAVGVHALEDKGLTLFPEPQQASESLALVLERIDARLGPSACCDRS